MLIFATAWHLREQTVTGQRCKSRTPGSEEKNKSDHQQVNTKGERERKGRESGVAGRPVRSWRKALKLEAPEGTTLIL